MDFTALEIFLVVAEQSSVTRTAAIIGRAPSNITNRVRALEDELGVALFSRDGKKMTLTREGRVFRSYARRLTTLAKDARNAVISAGPAEVLRVGTMESTAASRLPSVLQEFGQTYPAISLRLTIGATDELTRGVLSEEIDCALIARVPADLSDTASASSERQFDLLQANSVFAEDLLLVLPPTSRNVRTAADIQSDVLVALEPGCTYRRVAEHWIRQARQIRTVEVASYHAILANVVAGHAVGVVPRSVLEMMHWPSDIKTHTLGEVETLLIRRKDNQSPAFGFFHEALVANRASVVSR
ncbi:LysR family transcriptional regulator [Rhizobium lusitanum]|uniref:LysR family transcriptional regulator n=1 Tax=Rhizobium lusitanum TaxID=293958 RepID=A0A6L9UCE1_9HYPH|nr:LysR substrate-binding domain-containing protein [Rhizobium lusitanum]NEI71922.1 LysR family transcriptional regulator [Rhizobium lusitanum]